MIDYLSNESYAAGREATVAIHSNNPLDPTGLNRDMLKFWLINYANSALAWMKDGKSNLAEACAVTALRHIAVAREKGIDKVPIDGIVISLENLEARMKTIKQLPPTAATSH